MQFMNSSPSMTMVLQPDLCPPPPRPQIMFMSYDPPVNSYKPQRNNTISVPRREPVRPRHHYVDHGTSMYFDRGTNTAPYQPSPPPSRSNNTQARPSTRRYNRITTSRDSTDSPANYRKAPYAPREHTEAYSGGGGGGYSRPLKSKMMSMVDYDSIYDPHLMDYYAKKFGLTPHDGLNYRPQSAPSYGSSVRSYRFGSQRTRPSSARYQSRNTRGGDNQYKVTVRTGEKPNCGTDARVFIRIIGRKGKTTKQRLYKKSGQSKTFRFAKGSSHTMKIKGKDVGEVTKIVIEHDGLEERHSWFLKEVIVKDVHRGQSYTFSCGRWFSLFKEDCQLTRELNAVGGKQAKKIIYDITTVTGDKRGAGTNANVFITIRGSKGSTPRLRLKSDHKDTFERGQSDSFQVRSVNVGKIKKIRIEIDNQGFAPAWFLERVSIATRNEQVYFPCGQWLSRDERLFRDLIGDSDPTATRKSNKYKITTITGDLRGAGTNANVYITLFGDKGESGQQSLDNEKNNFERGKKDVFTIECPHLGTLKKIRIGHDNAGPQSGWYLASVIVDDTMMGKVYKFPCDRWFAKDEDDGKISRELIAGKGEGGIPYVVSVYTGDVRGAATDAKVYIIMYGGRKGDQTSGKIFLDGPFSRNRVSVSNLECASMLSPLDKIEVGHDNSGLAPGWFLEKIIVTCSTTGIEQVFPCSKWFATDEGDGLISRELFESKSLRKTIVTKSAWNCFIWTTDKRNAGTDANVFIQVYGDKGQSDEIPLNNETDNFESGQKDRFKIDFPDLGQIYKLRVWHDNARTAPGWHLDKITLEQINLGKKSGATYNFVCKKWLASDADDGEIVREIPASGPLVRKPQPLVRYHVAVHTGDKLNAGTNADVFCCIYGEQGDTGQRLLQKSKTSFDKFERNKVDEFVIEAVTLKQVNKIRIGHSDAGLGSGWFLSKVVVSEEGGGQSVTFPCERWLAIDEDDGLIVRDLFAEGSPQLLNTTSYHVSVKTGDVRGAGTDADVFLKIFGSNGDTGRLRLYQGENQSIRNKFERARTDLFKLEAADIGIVKRIIIGHDDTGIGSGWFLDSVKIDVPSHGQHYTFGCHRWLAVDENDGKTEVELYPTQVKNLDKLLAYEITVQTGDILNGGTDANVHLQLYGTEGKSETLKLRNRTDNFERNAVDKFKVEAADVGPIMKIRVGHDGSGLGSGWYLNHIKIQRFVKKTSKRKRRSRRATSPTPGDQGEIETYWFVCNRWFDTNEDDKQIIRELVPTDESGRPLDDALQEIEYTCHVYTGDKMGAGTDSNVFMTLYGEYGDTGERQLEQSENNVNKFERKQDDIFKLKAFDLGELKKLKIRHDNSVIGSAWFLDRVEVHSAKEVMIFPCQRWLSTKEDDGQIERTLVPVDQGTYARLQQQKTGKKKTGVKDAMALEMKASLTTYEVSVKTGDVRGAGTDANVYLILFGEDDDSAKINLKTSKTYRDKFERGHLDVFTVESAYLGNLKKIKIGHDNTGIGTAAWYLEYVEVDSPSEGRKWRFPCGRWLDTSRDDGLLERELYAATEDTIEYAAKVPYEITVYTSDVSGAGTDADVYVVLYGRDGVSTEKASLCPSKDERKSKFEKKCVDRFVLELDDIGESIEKLRIGHDGKGWGAGWHLNKVEVRRLLQGLKESETYLFECNRWLARDEDDGQIVRELAPVSKVEERVGKHGKINRQESKLTNVSKNQQYKVHVYTGDIFNAGTDANVYITIFGDNGDSGERKLMKSETNSDKFERGKEDVFKLEAVDLGKLYKVHIRHDNALLNPSWFLDRVEVEDCETNQTAVFHCERWLAKGKDDGKIARSLYVVGYDGETSTKRSLMTSRSMSSTNSKYRADALPEGPTISYTVKVCTGSQEGSGCQADAFIKIFGPISKKKKTERMTHRIPLIPAKGKFKKGTAETMQVEAVDVGEIKRIEIGHNGVDDTWFIDQVQVDVPTQGKHYMFPCGKWFARNKEDGLTVRPFTSEDATSHTYTAKIPYEVTLNTGNVQSAGTDSKLLMSIFGAKGSAPDISIVKNEELGILLERGSVDTINIEIDAIAPLKMVRISSDGKGARPDWFCEKISLRNLNDGKVTVFPCGAWFSKTMGDKTLTRELSASIGGKSVLPKTTFTISVKTSDMRGSGTDANVSCMLFGTNGETSELQLKESTTKKRKFERNHTDTFVFTDRLSIGELTKCRIWHDNKGLGAGWHLDSVEVNDSHADRTYQFKCNRWLADNEDDKQVMRDLPVEIDGKMSARGRKQSISFDLKPKKYEVIVKTSGEKGSGTDANVCITIYGTNGDSGKRPLKKSFRDLFERNQTDKFTLEVLDLGELQKIRLEHDDAGFNADWLCESVTIHDPVATKSWIFQCQEWIGGKKAFGQLHREITARPMD